MKATTIFLFLLIILAQCHEPKKVKEIKSENTEQNHKENQENGNFNKVFISTDYEGIKSYCANSSSFSTFSDTLSQIDPVSKEFISNLKIPDLKFEEEIDGIHSFNFFVLNSKLNGSNYYFTLLSKSATINISRLYLIVIDRESGEINEWKEIAEKIDYEGSVKNFKAKCLQNEIEIEQHATNYNKGKLQSSIIIKRHSINEEQKISSRKIKSRSFIGKEDAIYLEFDQLFKITIPNMYCLECDLTETNPMYRSSTQLSKKDTSSFELAELWGISGNIAGNKMILNFNEDNIKINSIKTATASGIFFNQEGNGSVWQVAGSPLSDWITLPINENFECIIPNTKTILQTATISAEQLNKAEKKKQENSELSFSILPAYMIFEIDYIAYNKPTKKYIEFVMGYGD